VVWYYLIEHKYYVELLLIAEGWIFTEKPCCVEEMKCIVISELNKNTLWNYSTQVTNDAADNDLSRSMIFNI
jgi:hypothetical protein